MNKRRFKIVLIVPSHYDDDGYVIQWLRSLMPSNSLASVYGLLQQCAYNKVLGDGVDMARDDMTAELVAGFQRALEIDAAADLPVLEVRARQAFGRNLHREPVHAVLDRREAHA